MTRYTPELADEVLVMYGVYRGGVGTVTDITDDRGFLVEGKLPTGAAFSRWHTPGEITPARWGTWRIRFTTVSARATDGLVADMIDTALIRNAPIEPLEMILDGMRDAPWFIVDAPGGERVGVATRHIEQVRVDVLERRDSR